LRVWHFWLWTIGVLVMFLDLMVAGLIHGFMQRDLNDWSDILRMSEPFWWVRTLSGVLITSGLLCALYNMVQTARTGTPYEERRAFLPAEAS
jgi:cytochrome c oxidase cbb3-type subunit 1